MLKIENIEVFNLEGAMRGLRNPMNSWDKSDSFYCFNQECTDCPYAQITKRASSSEDIEIICEGPLLKCVAPAHDGQFTVGPNDLNLCQRMIAAGDSDAKFMRQIMVCMDIVAPLYWY